MARNDQIINIKYNCGILFLLIKNTSDVTYFQAMGNVMGYLSFVGGYTDLKKNTFEIYFKSEEYLKTFFEKYGSIVVNGISVAGRPTTSVKMNLIINFIKNVHPGVPNSVIRTILTESYKLPIGPRIELCHTKTQATYGPDCYLYSNGNRTVSIEIDAEQKIVIPKKIACTCTISDEEYEIYSELMLKGKLACLSCQAFTHLASSCSLSGKANWPVKEELHVAD